MFKILVKEHIYTALKAQQPNNNEQGGIGSLICMEQKQGDCTMS